MSQMYRHNCAKLQQIELDENGEFSNEATSLAAVPERVKWSVRLLGNRNGFVVVIGLAAVCAGLIGIAIFRSPSMGLLGFAMILASTADYWMGSKFTVDEKGAHARVGLSLTSMEWKDVRRVIVEPNAIKLSPLEDGSKMDAFRGVLLRTRPDVRATVLEVVTRRIPKNVLIQTRCRESPA